MGYQRHHAIVVTAFLEGNAQEAHQKALELEMIVTPVIDSPLNGHQTFTVCPDGSNEGWDESKAGDRSRHQLIEWMEAQAVLRGYSPWDWVEIQYGDDDGATLVKRSSEEVSRALLWCEERGIDLKEET